MERIRVETWDRRDGGSGEGIAVVMRIIDEREQGARDRIESGDDVECTESQ